MSFYTPDDFLDGPPISGVAHDSFMVRQGFLPRQSTPDHRPAAGFFGPAAPPVPLNLRHREWRSDLVLGDTFGVHLVLDLTRCRLESTGSEEKVAEWNTTLCKAIDMSRYGDPFVKTFGFGNPKTPGVTLLQPIETSNLAFHEIRKLDGTAGACIDVFSCQLFDPQIAVEVSIAAFGGRVAAMSLLVRGEASPLRPTPGWFQPSARPQAGRRQR